MWSARGGGELCLIAVPQVQRVMDWSWGSCAFLDTLLVCATHLAWLGFGAWRHSWCARHFLSGHDQMCNTHMVMN